MIDGHSTTGRIATAVAVASVCTVSVLPAAASALSPPVSAIAGAADEGDFAGLVDIGDGRRLYLECRGSGSPTVVFSSGFGNGADIWGEAGAEAWRASNPGASGIAVLPAVAQLTRACAYDRPNTFLITGEPSRSDPVQAPRSVDAMVAELWALLYAADVPGPYVLVGHSMGGMVARLFAGTYPDEVVGFVSVDAAHESYYEAYKQLLSPDQYQSVYEAATAEIDIEGAATRMREARIDQPLHPMPMVVLEHSRDRAVVPNPFGLPTDYPIEALELVWQAAQEDLTTLVPGAQHALRMLTRPPHCVLPDGANRASRPLLRARMPPRRWPPSRQGRRPVGSSRRSRKGASSATAPLAASASKYSAWWNNEQLDTTHVQAHAWLNAGCEVEFVDRAGRRVCCSAARWRRSI